jgi:hypothetical protein
MFGKHGPAHYNFGRAASDETKEKLSLIRKGKPQSPEHKQKRIEALKAYHKKDDSKKLKLMVSSSFMCIVQNAFRGTHYTLELDEPQCALQIIFAGAFFQGLQRSAHGPGARSRGTTPECATL